MKITLIAHNLTVAGGLSVGRNIVKTMPDIAPMHEYLMIVPEGCGYPDFDEYRNVSVLKCPKMPLWKRHLWWDRDVLQREVRAYRPQWVWCLGNIGLIHPPARQSILFQNAYLLNYSAAHFGASAGSIPIHLLHRYQRHFLYKSLRNTSRVYCQTNTASQRFSQTYGFSIEKIGLCPNAFSIFHSRFGHMGLASSGAGNFFRLLCVTRYYPHKNIERIIDTFEQYREQLTDVICILLIAPEQGKKCSLLIDRIRDLKLDQQLQCIGKVSQEKLGKLFAAADVMFLPTLLESFSGTYLETMAFNTPVLTSDLDFAHEVCGDAAYYVDPFSAESIKDGILALKNDVHLRCCLIERGQARYKGHVKSWPEILRNVLDQEGIEHE